MAPCFHTQHFVMNGSKLLIQQIVDTRILPANRKLRRLTNRSTEVLSRDNYLHNYLFDVTSLSSDTEPT